MPRLRTVVILATVALAAIGAQAAMALSPNPEHIGLKPVLGWSSWSSFRFNVSTAKLEGEARAMISSGLTKLGYRNIDLDENWYQCPAKWVGGNPVQGKRGPNVDRWGRWVVNSRRFPGHGTASGIKVLADYLHRHGLKFGIYVTPGISAQAVKMNTPVEGNVGGHLTGKPSGYTARQIATRTPQLNYNCGGMVGLNFRSPGAQKFVDSWADMLASWGVDFVKLDGIANTNVADIKAWAKAIRQTGRRMNLDVTQGEFTYKIARTLDKYATQWVPGPDIECYSCEPGSTSGMPHPDAFPLTAWKDAADSFRAAGVWWRAGVVGRFAYAARWARYARPGAFNDLDSVEVGNGIHDGISIDARKTVLSLWSLASSPLILGSDLQHLVPQDLALLKNRAVLAVDQDAIAAHRVRNTATVQIFIKRERSGDVIVGLFNINTKAAERISIDATSVGLPLSLAGYTINDLWTHQISQSSGPITATVPAEGVALFRITPS